MPVQTQVVRFQKSTGANGSTTDVNLNFTPKAIIIFSNGGTADATNEAHFQEIVGFSDGTTGACISTCSEDAAAASDAGRVHSVIVFEKLSTTTPTTIVCSGTCVFATNKVTFTWVINDAVATDITLWAIGGTDITGAKVNTVNIGRNTAGTQDYTGLGFNPSNGKSALFMLATNTGSLGVGETHASGMFSCATATRSLAVDSGKQWVIGNLSEHAADPSDTWRHSSNDRNFAIVDAAGAYDHFGFLEEWITNGFRMNWDNPPTSSTNQISYLVINGGNWDSGTLIAPVTATNNVDYPVSVDSKTIRGLLMAGVGSVTSAAINAVNLYSIGATDGTTHSAISAIDEDAQATMDSYRYSDTTSLVYIMTTNGALTDRATFDSFGNNSFRLDWPTKTVNAQLTHWVVVADSPTAIPQAFGDTTLMLKRQTGGQGTIFG